MIAYVSDVSRLIDRAGDIVMMSMIISSLIIGFAYALAQISIQKTLSFLPFFK